MQEQKKKKKGTAARSSKSRPKAKSRKKNKGLRMFWRIIKRLISVILTTLLSVFLIAIITGTIVTTAGVVYVLDFMEEATSITLEEMELSYNTNVYGYDEDGNLSTLYQVNNEVQRIPVSIEEIPQHTLDAFVYTEDERFYTHDGVDYKNTIAAMANLVLNFWDTERGGSTITQQLIKNVTGDDDPSPSRKIREIFRAMTLEKNYSKQKIIETYLNYIGFGGSANGIEMAAIKYFGKNVGDLTIAESAVLAAIPQSPETINPFAYYIDDETHEKVMSGRKRNRERQEYVLWQMYDHGAISYDEYQEALSEHLIFTDTTEYKELHPELQAKEVDDDKAVMSWTVETALREVQEYLMETHGISKEDALHRINTGGYQIYTTIDPVMQAYVEEKYLSLDNLIDTRRSARYQDDTNGDGEVDSNDDPVYPQSAFIAMNYEGEVLCCVGAIGEKTDSLVMNFATMETRQPGSTIKPVAGYGCGIFSDEFHWGSKIRDYGLTMPDGSLWPSNYSTTGSLNYSGSELFMYYGLMKSLNTISAHLVDDLTPEVVYSYATERMGLKLTEVDGQGLTDIDLSPLSVGALTYGVTIKNMVNAYVPYGNGGVYYKAHVVSRLEQGNHELVYDDAGDPHDVIDPETAYVMNRMMTHVVSPSGTAGAAMLKNKQVVGKTGTTQEWGDLWFIGLTEDFVSGVWIGYPKREMLDTSINSAKMWYNVIGEYADAIESDAEYPVCETVIEAPMCSNTGMIANAGCPKGETGYWKSTNAPYCDKNHTPVSNRTNQSGSVRNNYSSNNSSSSSSSSSSGGITIGGTSGNSSSSSSSSSSGSSSGGIRIGGT